MLKYMKTWFQEALVLNWENKNKSAARSIIIKLQTKKHTHIYTQKRASLNYVTDFFVQFAQF